MNSRLLVLLMILSFALPGCVVRSYQNTRDRVDQELSGNRGYLMGQAPEQTGERKMTRSTQVVEVELRPLFKFGKKSKKNPVVSESSSVDNEEWGNRGIVSGEAVVDEASSEAFEKYTVAKGDTLQKISQKLYGTTKKWVKIYNLNKDTLKAPDKIYPGQSIKVPAGAKQVSQDQGMKEPSENLK